jgi:hypothetical protein
MRSMNADCPGPWILEISAETSASEPDAAGVKESTSGCGGTGFSTVQPPAAKAKRRARKVMEAFRTSSELVCLFEAIKHLLFPLAYTFLKVIHQEKRDAWNFEMLLNMH